MMITVRDALQLSAFKDAELVAGKDGLDRIISSVNIMEVPDIIRFVKKDELLVTTTYPIKDDKGIYYGMGMMYFDFGELSFLLGSMKNVYGGMGITGTYMFYDKEKDTYFIANFGSVDFTEKSIQELIKIRMIKSLLPLHRVV